MIELQRRVQPCLPAWFQGARARRARPLLRGFRRLSRPEQVNALLARPEAA
ncbi:MAG: hypothetical protein K0M70_07280 [Arenimonas sp.]|uniref:hypothetical protein n=1 Tax=Arenimonas sp. TaxID=1872635 RepID=UPI0025C503E4|nr:hypothetical protein [Arenimonas sp.]MBW8367641.1 hypothetical protein [Arenimonas sp.]